MLRAGERRNEEVTVKGRVESQDSAGRAREGQHRKLNGVSQSFGRRRQWHPTPVPLPGESHG